MRFVIVLCLLCGAKCAKQDPSEDAYDACRAAYIHSHKECFEQGVQICLDQIGTECN